MRKRPLSNFLENGIIRLSPFLSSFLGHNLMGDHGSGCYTLAKVSTLCLGLKRVTVPDP